MIAGLYDEITRICRDIHEAHDGLHHRLRRRPWRDRGARWWRRGFIRRRY